MPIVESTFEERLLSRYEVADSGCWQWTSTLTWGGYGQISRAGLERNCTPGYVGARAWPRSTRPVP